MHVCYVLGQNTGGLPHYTAELANAVAEHAEVTVLKATETSADDVFDPAVDVREAFSPLGISMPRIARREIAPLEVARGILSYRHVRSIREMDVDVVHDATGLFPQTKFFLKLYGIDEVRPLVVTLHEVEKNRFSLARPSHFAEGLVDMAIPDVVIRRTIVHTENQKRALVDRGASPEDVAVIPHGAYSMFGDHEDLDGPPEENTLLFFGNVVRQKGIATLVRAVPLIAREIPDVKLIIAGDGQIPPDVADIVESHPRQFERHDRFIPNDEVKEFFERAQVVVVPYHEREGGTNGHSGTLATALSFGKPVVASRAGDFPSLVEGSGVGRVVPSGDPERLAATVTALLRDNDARREMAANSRRLAEELSWDTIAEKHLDLYKDVTRTKPRPAVQ